MQVYTFDFICECQDFNHNEEFVLKEDLDSEMESKQKEITALEARGKKLVDFCNKFINEMPHYEDCDSESPEDELNCNCGVSFERKTYREVLKELGVE